MSNERATKEYKTKNGHTIVAYTYATGREFNLIQDIYLEGAKINVIGGLPNVDGFDPKADGKANEKAIELLIRSVDGEANEVVSKILDLPYTDYSEVMLILNELTGKKTPSESKTRQ